MPKEVDNHIVHMSRTFERLLTVLFSDDELEQIYATDPETIKYALSSKKAWIKTSDLVDPGINTEKMALIHLLYFQSTGRVVIEDIDPFSGAVLLHLNFDDIQNQKNDIWGN